MTRISVIGSSTVARSVSVALDIFMYWNEAFLYVAEHPASHDVDRCGFRLYRWMISDEETEGAPLGSMSAMFRKKEGLFKFWRPLYFCM